MSKNEVSPGYAVDPRSSETRVQKAFRKKRQTFIEYLFGHLHRRMNPDREIVNSTGDGHLETLSILTCRLTQWVF